MAGSSLLGLHQHQAKYPRVHGHRSPYVLYCRYSGGEGRGACACQDVVPVNYGGRFGDNPDHGNVRSAMLEPAPMGMAYGVSSRVSGVYTWQACTVATI